VSPTKYLTSCLYYPAEYSYIFEKYWDQSNNLADDPEFSDESSFTQDCMNRYAAALSSMNLEDFVPLVHAEAKSSDVRIAMEAAISRLLPIHDGPDLWAHLEELSRSSSVTGSGGPAPS
jgi:hypothetical protein